MADRIVVMDAGKISQVGTPLELYDRPANKFVAGFIGSPAMSFVDAIYRSEGGPHLTLPSGAQLQVTPHQLADGTPVTIGIRPETYIVDDNGPLALTVFVVEPTGPETHIFGALEGHELRCVLRDRRKVAVGDTLRLSVDPANLHLFSRESGTRLD